MRLALATTARGAFPFRSSSCIRCFSSTVSKRAPFTEHVRVPCASAGHVTVSLHGLASHPTSSAVIVNFPAFPVENVAHVDSYLPRFLHRYPSITIHYRWPRIKPKQDSSSSSSSSSSPSSHNESIIDDTDNDMLCWPTPVHDAIAAYDHLTRILSPAPTSYNKHSRLQRRDIYFYGSYLGAGIAASLALTESHAHEPVAVRGLVALNGVYNWTTFLADHPLNKKAAKLAVQDEGERDQSPDLNLKPGLLEERDTPTPSDINLPRSLMPSLFRHPSDLFDPFASPILFFHTAGMLVPDTFTEPWRPKRRNYLSSLDDPTQDDNVPDVAYVYSDPEDPFPPTSFQADGEGEEDETYAELNGTLNDADSTTTQQPPSDTPNKTITTLAPPSRKGYLAFPARTSTLKIPQALLLHSSPPPPPPTTQIQKTTKPPTRGKPKEQPQNSFSFQATALAAMMMRSVNKIELRYRLKWDPDYEGWETEAGRRIETVDIGPGAGQVVDATGKVGDIGREAEKLVKEWFAARLN